MPIKTIMSSVPTDPQDEVESPPRPKSRERKRNFGVSKEYLCLLNGTIQDANSRKRPSKLPVESSQIGATFWSAAEKEMLFSQLEIHGPGNLRLLQHALPKKSESEIQAYLLLLQENSAEDLKTSPNGFSLEVVPAAFEISEECESKLQVAADVLSARVYEQDALAAQDEYGDDWLIDEELAEQIEEQCGEREESGAAEPDNSDDDDDAAKAVGQETLLSPAATEQVLRPSSFLALSRSLFMNSSEHPDLNWQILESISEDVSEPAIFKSALEDFYNFTVNITRRVVQATLFQAMTRLRASDSSRSGWTPVAAVREVDVRSAVAFLDMKPEWKPYWRSVAKRNQVQVYTDSKKYADGRPGTKVGHLLTDSEVAVELGGEPSTSATVKQDLDITEADVDDLMEDDVFTDVPSDEPLPPDKPTKSRPRPSKRKRASSPSTFARAEERYLNALDIKASQEEEKRLDDSLRLFLPPVTSHPIPQAPGPPPESELTSANWRDRIDYEAEWGHPSGTLESEMFQEMEMRGNLGKKRRKKLLLGVQRRLDESRKSDGEWKSDSDAHSKKDESGDEAEDSGEGIDGDEDEVDEDDENNVEASSKASERTDSEGESQGSEEEINDEQTDEECLADEDDAMEDTE